MGGVPVRQSPHERCPPVSGLSWFSGLGIGVFAVDLKIAVKFYVYENEAPCILLEDLHARNRSCCLKLEHRPCDQKSCGSSMRRVPLLLGFADG